MVTKYGTWIRDHVCIHITYYICIYVVLRYVRYIGRVCDLFVSLARQKAQSQREKNTCPTLSVHV